MDIQGTPPGGQAWTFGWPPLPGSCWMTPNEIMPAVQVKSIEISVFMRQTSAFIFYLKISDNSLEVQGFTTSGAPERSVWWSYLVIWKSKLRSEANLSRRSTQNPEQHRRIFESSFLASWVIFTPMIWSSCLSWHRTPFVYCSDGDEPIQICILLKCYFLHICKQICSKVPIFMDPEVSLW